VTTTPSLPGAHPTRARHRTATIDGVGIFYREAGAPAAPTIILLHGWPSSSFHYRELIPLLAENFHVVAPDYPGLGFSDTPPRAEYEYSFPHTADMLWKLADELGIDRCALYLHDFGAGIGWLMARKAPERVTAILNQNGPAYNVGVVNADDPEWQANIELYNDPTNPERRARMADALSFDYTKFTYVTGACDLELVAPDTYHLDYALFQRPDQLEIQVDLLISYADYVLNELPLAQAYLRQHQPPLLCVWGANDPYYPKEGTDAFRADVPDVEIHLYDAGHFALETHVNEIAATITEFLQRRL
jgi:pimeloyl-ACP methyl ester carboxylesterase